MLSVSSWGGVRCDPGLLWPRERVKGSVRSEVDGDGNGGCCW